MAIPMKWLDKYGIITIASFVVCSALFAILAKLSGLGITSVIEIPLMLTSLPAVPIIMAVAAFILLALGFSSLAVYGYFIDEKRTGAIAAVASAIITIAVLQSVVSVFIGIGIIIAGIFIIPLANTYGRELRRWAYFRTGANASSKALMIVNALAAVGIFIVVFANVAAYQASMKENFTGLALGALPAGITDAQKEMLKAEAIKAIEKSPIFSAFMNWLPVVTAVSAWALLEIVRAAILSNAAGAHSSALIRMKKSKAK